jgi:hypothetical protein
MASFRTMEARREFPQDARLSRLNGELVTNPAKVFRSVLPINWLPQISRLAWVRCCYNQTRTRRVNAISPFGGINVNHPVRGNN